MDPTPADRTPLTPDAWRRIGAVLDRVSSLDLRLQPEALAEACRAEGVRPEEVAPFLTAGQERSDLPEQVDPVVLDEAVRSLAGDTTRDPLGAGDHLGPYEILGLLGSGGMGEVYKARDTRLGRTVALKRLQADLAARPDGRLRFEREARAISGLNHPHICTLHDVGQQDDVEFLVMELVEGETLADRLQRGALPLKDALMYAAQMADALAAAHRQGIVHRDLKPANVMLTAHGVKVLDFGLAALRAPTEPIPPSGGHGLTATSRGGIDPSLTAEGTILGTLQYMSPEQLQGKAVDARTDIFALGAMLHEMITGRRAFDGDSPANIIAAVLERDPPTVDVGRDDVPPALAWVVAQCLAKEPDRRWQSAADLARQLKWIAASPSVGAPQTRISRRHPLVWLAMTVAAVLVPVVGIVIYLTTNRGHVPSEPYRYEISPPDGTTLERTFKISPDGRRLAFTATDASGIRTVWIRPLDALTPQRIDGTEGAFYPFWSPDGRMIAFFADNKLKKVELATNTVQVICEAGFGGGGTWNADGVILFAAQSAVATVLQRVSASGGAPTPITRLEREFGIHGWPEFLPDGRHYLYMRLEPVQASGVYVGRLDSDERKPILTREGYDPVDEIGRATYAAGYLFYDRGRALFAQPFDAVRLQPTGEPVRVAESIAVDAPGRSAYDVSSTGVLAYRPPSAQRASQLTWINRAGREIGLVGAPRASLNATLSPDGNSVLVDGGPILRIDVAAGTSTQVTRGGVMPVWNPDGTQLVFRGGPGRGPTVSVAPTDGSDLEGSPLGPALNAWPGDWSTDGVIVGTAVRPETSWYDLWALVVGKPDGVSFPVASRFDEADPQLSPDRRWLAYAATDESKDWNVYVQPFDRPGGALRVSRDGGRRPQWSKDGRELFYVQPDGTLMSTVIDTRAAIQVVSTTALFRHPALSEDFTRIDLAYPYDIAPDGQRFLVRVPVGSRQPAAIAVLLNWHAQLKR